MGRVISDELFHFVGSKSPEDDEANFATLKAVLASQCVTYDPSVIGWGVQTITISWDKSLLNGELVVPTMTCFCDIPYAHLGHTHIANYGHFGLSLKKSHLVKFGARPVTYIPLHDHDLFGLSGRTLVQDIEILYRAFNEHLDQKFCSGDESPGRRIGKPPVDIVETVAGIGTLLLRDFLSFIKVYDSTLLETDKRYYYAEREWRRCGAVRFGVSEIGTVVVAPKFLTRARREWPSLDVKPSPT
jgi:Putative abortive phage resistance protein AbiGi, antitoxin